MKRKCSTPGFDDRRGYPLLAFRPSFQPLAPNYPSHWPTSGACSTRPGPLEHQIETKAFLLSTPLPATSAMSHTRTQLGGVAFNHGPSSASEQEYDRLRDLARKEQGQHQHFAAQSQAAYQRGDGGEAHRLSEQGKQHAAQADAYNQQASEYIFRENNAVGKVAGDTIDLHGQYVEEAEEILEQRIRYARQAGQTHLHVIVGKGNHSPGHIQKIKPRVEQVCQELGLQYRTEQNEGRMYIDLQGGAVHQLPAYDYGSQHQPQHQGYGQPHYETAYPMGGYAGQQHGGSARKKELQEESKVRERLRWQTDKLYVLHGGPGHGNFGRMLYLQGRELVLGEGRLREIVRSREDLQWGASKAGMG
nr:smr domain-containing protein [Quercus suber]